MDDELIFGCVFGKMTAGHPGSRASQSTWWKKDYRGRRGLEINCWGGCLTPEEWVRSPEDKAIEREEKRSKGRALRWRGEKLELSRRRISSLLPHPPRCHHQSNSFEVKHVLVTFLLRNSQWLPYCLQDKTNNKKKSLFSTRPFKV